MVHPQQQNLHNIFNEEEQRFHRLIPIEKQFYKFISIDEYLILYGNITDQMLRSIHFLNTASKVG